MIPPRPGSGLVWSVYPLRPTWRRRRIRCCCVSASDVPGTLLLKERERGRTLKSREGDKVLRFIDEDEQKRPPLCVCCVCVSVYMCSTVSAAGQTHTASSTTWHKLFPSLLSFVSLLLSNVKATLAFLTVFPLSFRWRGALLLYYNVCVYIVITLICSLHPLSAAIAVVAFSPRRLHHHHHAALSLSGLSDCEINREETLGTGSKSKSRAEGEREIKSEARILTPHLITHV